MLPKKKKKTLWFIGVEVEQVTSAPPPEKNPGSAPEKPSVCVLVLLCMSEVTPRNLGNLESGRFLLMESRILEFGIQFKESEIPLLIGIRNTSSIDKESAIQFLESKTVLYDKSAR